MKNRFIVVYSVFAIAVFVFSISFFGFNLYKEYSTNTSKTESRYTNLVNDIRTLSYNQEANNSTYVQGIKNAVGDAGYYSFIQVRRNGETIVLYPSGKMKEETVSRLTKNYNSTLTVNKQNVTVDCNLYLIRPDSIFYYARISFLMILIITIITIIMIIYLNLSEASSDVISLEEEDDEAALDEEEESEEEVITEESTSTETEAAEESETVSEETEKPEEENESHAQVTPEEVKAILSEPLTDEQAKTEEKAAAETAPAAEAPAAEPAKLPVDEIAPASTEPSGLFDPDTGIGWESYLLTRLDNEIDRATASEIDLSLFVFKLPSVERKSEVFKNICNYLAIQFQFKDLLFEHRNDCIVAIQISMNVDEALNLADKLYSDISNMINSNSCRIGISSRSIRMVSGARLILEAEQAIEHADAKSPVIAFRVDSEKYRQLMEGNQA